MSTETIESWVEPWFLTQSTFLSGLGFTIAIDLGGLGGLLGAFLFVALLSVCILQVLF